jgi:general secretion pathway protein G
MLSTRKLFTGFSFVELLASVAIVGLLAAVALPAAEITARRTKEAQLRAALKELRLAIDAYKAAVDAGKISISPEQSGYPPNLADLANGIDDLTGSGIKLYFLRRIPRDPMHPDTTIPAAETWGLRSFDSPPDRPRPGVDVFDVYSLSDKKGINGVSYADW